MEIVDASGNIVAADPKVLPRYLLYVNASLCVESISRTKRFTQTFVIHSACRMKTMESCLKTWVILVSLSSGSQLINWCWWTTFVNSCSYASWHATIPWTWMDIWWLGGGYAHWWRNP
jgi:hypothetical protein